MAKKKNTYLFKEKPWSWVSVTVEDIAIRVSEPAAASTAAATSQLRLGLRLKTSAADCD
ncbi:hypothetical protein HanIR_Chr17g0856401 [Helianthus annuus]|nr:hypothetical protein HanIR_Chr17g0856401 [Helianthus annuus]